MTLQAIAKAAAEIMPSTRRWLALINPRLSELICDAIGEGWVRELERMEGYREEGCWLLAQRKQ